MSEISGLGVREGTFIIDDTDRAKLRVAVEIGCAIGTSTDTADLLNFILNSVHQVVDYDAAGIFIFDQDASAARYIAGRGYGESVDFDVILLNGAGIVGRVISTGESVITADVSEDPHYLNLRQETRSQLTVPIIIDDKVIGAFNLESDRPADFTEKDLEWLRVLATHVGISIDRANHRQESLERKHIDDELRIAREVQLGLLPVSAPNVEGLDIAGINIPSRSISGDYYDFIPITQGQIGIAIADVAGKGVPAALIMASFRAFLRAEIRNNYAIRTTFNRVNNLLNEILQSHQFVTAFYGVFDLERKRFTYSNAGHNRPLLMRADGRRRLLKCGGTVMGIFEKTLYDEEFIDLDSGDLIVLYTDGLLEAENNAGEMFGYKRLARLVRANADLPANELCETVYQDMRRFTGENHLKDDTTVVVARIL